MFYISTSVISTFEIIHCTVVRLIFLRQKGKRRKEGKDRKQAKNEKRNKKKKTKTSLTS